MRLAGAEKPSPFLGLVCSAFGLSSIGIGHLKLVLTETIHYQLPVVRRDRTLRRALFSMTYFLRLVAACLLASLWAHAQSAGASAVTLDQAIKEALQKNLSLLAERFNIPIAEARIITARLRPNPVLTVDGDYLDILGTGFSPSNGAGPAEAAIRTDFVLEGARKREKRIAVAELSKSFAQLGVANTVPGITLELASAFLDLPNAQQSLPLAQTTLPS